MPLAFRQCRDRRRSGRHPPTYLTLSPYATYKFSLRTGCRSGGRRLTRLVFRRMQLVGSNSLTTLNSLSEMDNTVRLSDVAISCAACITIQIPVCILSYSRSTLETYADLAWSEYLSYGYWNKSGSFGFGGSSAHIRLYSLQLRVPMRKADKETIPGGRYISRQDFPAEDSEGRCLSRLLSIRFYIFRSQPQERASIYTKINFLSF
jgi:hypothetical protein